MEAVIKVLQGVPESIVGSRRPQGAGLLVGLRDGNQTMVLSALHCEEDDLTSTKEVAAALLPPPLAVVGYYGAAGASHLHTRTEPGGLAVVVGKEGGLEYFVRQGGGLGSCQPKVVGAAAACTSDGLLAELAAGYVPVRCVADLVVTTSDRGGAESLKAAFEDLEEQLCGPAAIYVAEALPGSSGGGGGGGATQPALPGSKPFAALGASWTRALVLRPYQRASPAAAAAGCVAPQMSWQPGADTLRHAALRLDVLCYVPAGMPGADAVGAVVRPAVRRQLRCMRAHAQQAAAAGASPALPPQRALHFRPPGYCHHVTLLYPLPAPCTEAEEEAQLPRRKALHRLLGLPPDRPLLRVAHAVDWSGGGGGGGGGGLDAALSAGGVGGRPRLRDVHVGLPPPPLGGSVHLVQGSYDYYHYMQDKFDDCGWGCAYRSLQTLCSWYARQHYAARPPPSHREVQAALVQIGDKEPSFIGSKQWIGAIELGFVLDALLGVSHRVLRVGSGDELPSLARQIAHHFDTQGTPIMIGGGVLAYTLLGIEHEERSGRCSFLILDPHYTGGEEVKKVHAGQWVAWKQPGDKAAAGGDLFVASSFYNLLCPQRPATV